MTVEFTFSLGFFGLEGNPSLCMRVLYYDYGFGCILGARNIEGDCEREQRILQRIYYRLCLFILLDNRKEGMVVWGGRNPNWVNHAYFCLSDFKCFLCLCFPHILYVVLLCNI